MPCRKEIEGKCWKEKGDEMQQLRRTENTKSETKWSRIWGSDYIQDLGRAICTNGGMEVEVGHRLNEGTKMMCGLVCVQKSKGLLIAAEVRILEMKKFGL